jgi:hypothetical protein
MAPTRGAVPATVVGGLFGATFPMTDATLLQTAMRNADAGLATIVELKQEHEAEARPQACFSCCLTKKIFVTLANALAVEARFGQWQYSSFLAVLRILYPRARSNTTAVVFSGSQLTTNTTIPNKI